MSARADVPEVAEIAENSKFETVEFTGAVAGAGALSALAGGAIAGELSLLGADVVFCAERLTVEVAAVVIVPGDWALEGTAAGLAAGSADKPLPESPSKNLAAAVKSEKVATLKSPAACAVAPAAGVCADEVNSSAAVTDATGEADDFEVLDPCEVVGVLSAELCSVCGCD